MTKADRRTFLQTAGLTTAGLMTPMNSVRAAAAQSTSDGTPGHGTEVSPVAQAWNAVREHLRL